MKSHNIKDILEERRMEVSEDSWEKLAGQLDANDKKKKRRSIYPYAACIALLVGLITFIIGKNVGESQAIVDTDKTIQVQEEVETQKPIILEEAIHKEALKESTVEHKTSTQPKITTDKKEITGKEQLITSKQQKETAIAFQKEIQNAVVMKEKENLSKEVETIITQKDVVIDENKDLKASIVALSVAEKVTITDAEINQLLKEAEQSLSELDIKKEKDALRFATADELLNEVEDELDRSFKQKVFEIIKKNFKKGKTLLADRN